MARKRCGFRWRPAVSSCIAIGTGKSRWRGAVGITCGWLPIRRTSKRTIRSLARKPRWVVSSGDYRCYCFLLLLRPASFLVDRGGSNDIAATANPMGRSIQPNLPCSFWSGWRCAGLPCLRTTWAGCPSCSVLMWTTILNTSTSSRPTIHSRWQIRAGRCTIRRFITQLAPRWPRS